MRRLLLVLLAGGLGCQDGAPGLELTLKLSDPVYAATASARIIVSSTDGTSFPARAMSTAVARGLTVRNLDVDGNGAIDVVLELDADYPFDKSARFLLQPSGVSGPVNVAIRAEVFDGLANRLAKLGGPSRNPADERIAAIVSPGRLTRAQELAPACLGTCPDSTVRLGPGDATQILDAANGGVSALAAGNLTGALTRRADLLVAHAHQDRPAALSGGVAQPNAGQVSIYFGGGPLALQSTIVGGHGGDQLGAALAIGDLDGDGADELVIGAPGASGARGAVYVLGGGASWPATIDLAGGSAPPPWSGLQPGDRLGEALALADVDGDGTREIIAGAPGAATLYVLTMPPAGGAEVSGRPSLVGSPGSRLGVSLSALGDSLAAGAPGETGGAAYLFNRTRDFGQAGRPAPTAGRAAGSGGGFGVRVVLADLGAGPTLLVAAPDDGAGAVSGFPTGDLSQPPRVIRGRPPATQLGAALVRLARPLGDALFLGAPSALPSNRPGAGAAYLVRGPTLAVAPSFELSTDGRPAAAVLSGAKEGDGFGAAAAIGDFNADGFDDLAVAAPAAPAVTVFLGPLL